jgi:CBS domain-containing protein
MTLQENATHLVLAAETAQELMTPNPISVSQEVTVKEAITFLLEKGFTAMPVIDEAGHAVGVLSRTDILIFDRQKADYALPDYFGKADLKMEDGEEIPEGFQVESVDRTRVKEVMTPVIYSVAPETPAAKVVEELVNLGVHRLFVLDRDGLLLGVISTFDILKHLRPME